MPIVLQYYTPDELHPEACLDPKLASQTPRQVIRDFYDNVSQTPDKSELEILRAQLTRVPGGEQWSQGKLKRWFYSQRRTAKHNQRREHLVGEVMSQLQDVLPPRPRPYERTPKSFAELAQWMEAPNATSMTFLRDVAAGTYHKVGLNRRDVAPDSSYQEPVNQVTPS